MEDSHITKFANKGHAQETAVEVLTDNWFQKEEELDAKKNAKFEKTNFEEKGVWPKFVELCTTTTMHGVGNIFAEQDQRFLRSPRRIFWFCAVLACTIFSCYEISQNIKYYLGNPVNTVFKVEYVSELTFPVITICNNNPIRKSWAISSPYMRVVETYSPKPGQPSVSIDWNSYDWTGFSLDKLMFEAGHQMKDLVLECRWKSAPCSAVDFTPDPTFLGGCFAFNYNQSLRISGTGVDNALHLVLNVQQDEYVGNIRSGAGFRLIFRESHEPPDTDRFVIALQPGTQSMIPLTLKSHKSLPAPYGECEDKDNLQMFDKYSVTACVYECWARIGGERCGCREMYPAGIKTDIPICLPQKYRECLAPTLVEINSKGLCSKCKGPCQKNTYVPRISYSQYPANHIADHMAQQMNTTRQFIRDNFLEVNIYFEDMVIERMEQHPAYSLATLLGVMGGTLGVLIGASILTVSEFVEFFILLVASKLKSIQARSVVIFSSTHK